MQVFGGPRRRQGCPFAASMPSSPAVRTGASYAAHNVKSIRYHVVAARTRIVEGAVGMVEMALTRLTDQGVVKLDEERKAAMVSNLMVVLCGDQPPTPIVNAGTLYS